MNWRNAGIFALRGHCQECADFFHSLRFSCPLAILDSFLPTRPPQPALTSLLTVVPFSYHGRGVSSPGVHGCPSRAESSPFAFCEGLWNRSLEGAGTLENARACSLESEAHASLLTCILLPHDTRPQRDLCYPHQLINALLIFPFYISDICISTEG